MAQPRLSAVVLMLGINDIAWPGTAFGRLLPLFDSGDHLHPGDRGTAAPAAALSSQMLFGAPLRTAGR